MGSASRTERIDPDDRLPSRLRDDDVDRIVDALEERIIAELDRRGGRLSGLL